MSVDKLLQKALAHHRRMNFDEAKAIYKKIIKNNPDHLDAINLLGTLHAQQGNLKEAAKCLVKADQLNPFSPLVKVNLGNVYKEQGEYDLAIDCFTRAIELKPDLAQGYFGLGSVLHKTGEDIQKAKDNYFKALSLAPNIPEIHQGIGRIFFAEGSTEAVKCFETARDLNPRLKDILLDLGKAYLRYERMKDALECLKLANLQDPNDVSVQYFLAVAQGVEPDPKIADKYLSYEFDRFAPNFDKLLVGKLGYKPSQLVDAIVSTFGNERRFGSVVDLGCGTGLSGIAIKDHADRITGIDISENMLEAAAGRNCYDVLLQGNLLEVLRENDSRYDLFFAADVICYLGKLDGLFEAVSAKANDGAVLAFTTEYNEGDGIVLRPSGRYAHSTRYVTDLATEYAFHIACTKRIKLRAEAGDWIMGDIFVINVAR